VNPGKTQDTLEGLYLPAGLGTPRDPQNELESVAGEGSLVQSAATVTRPRISRRKWIDLCHTNLIKKYRVKHVIQIYFKNCLKSMVVGKYAIKRS